MIAIDPGASGGIAWRDRDGIVRAERMPEGMTAQVDRLREIAAELPPDYAVMERVGGYMPGNSAPAAVKFARHCGHIEAALYCLGVPCTQVAPQTWQRVCGALPHDKGERKRAVKEWAARRFPHLAVTLATADALAILAHAEGVNNSITGGEAVP